MNIETLPDCGFLLESKGTEKGLPQSCIVHQLLSHSLLGQV